MELLFGLYFLFVLMMILGIGGMVAQKGSRGGRTRTKKVIYGEFGPKRIDRRHA